MTGSGIAATRLTALRFSRRAFLRRGALAALAATLVACAPRGGGARQAEDRPVQLVYQDWRTAWFPALAQEALRTFHEQHPNIRVFFVPDPENLTEKMLADLAAGTAPDVFQGCCAHFPEWAQQGYVLDLRPYVEEHLDAATIADWSPAQYRSLFLPDGLQFGLPKYHGGLALYFNKDLLDAQGIAYPTAAWDHDDYAAAMSAATQHIASGDSAAVWGSMLDVSWERIQVHVNGWGGHLVDPDDPTRCLMGEPEALAAMEWIRARMWDDRVMATSLDVQNLSPREAFVAQRIAMVEDGSWALMDILSGADFRIGVAPFPAGPKRRVTLATTDGFGIYAGTKHPEAAWELVRFLVGKDYGRAMAQASFLQPARRSLIADWIGYIREQFPEQAADMDIAAFADGHVKGYSTTGEIFAHMADARILTYAAWEEIFTLGKAPVTMMQDVCRKIEALNASR